MKNSLCLSVRRRWFCHRRRRKKIAEAPLPQAVEATFADALGLSITFNIRSVWRLMMDDHINTTLSCFEYTGALLWLGRLVIHCRQHENMTHAIIILGKVQAESHLAIPKSHMNESILTNKSWKSRKTAGRDHLHYVRGVQWGEGSWDLVLDGQMVSKNVSTP